MFRTNLPSEHPCIKLSGNIWKNKWNIFSVYLVLCAYWWFVWDNCSCSYLQSLLENDATNGIAGLALTNANYYKAIGILKERYGQPHRNINAYMKSLLDLLEKLWEFENIPSTKEGAVLREQAQMYDIQDLVDQQPWRYCPTESHPADSLARGESSFKSNTIWLQGPDRIYEESLWPV